MPDDLMEAWIESDDAPWFEGGASWLTVDPYPAAMRDAFAPQYRHLPADQLDMVIEQAMESLSPLEAENFSRFISNLGRTVAPIAAQVLPVAAPIVGTVIGGPAGAAIGGTVGRLAGQALAGPASPRTARPPVPRPSAANVPPPPPVMAAAAPPASSPAVALPPPATADAPSAPSSATGAIRQLLSFLQHPALLQSMLGAALGGAGARAVAAGPNATPVPFGAFMNALSVLANQAASEAEGFGEPDESEATAYLRDASGEFRYDPAVAEERAGALLALLGAHETHHGSVDAGWTGESYDNGDAREGIDDWFARAGLLR